MLVFEIAGSSMVYESLNCVASMDGSTCGCRSAVERLVIV
jgi:hypothetical protein